MFCLIGIRAPVQLKAAAWKNQAESIDGGQYNSPISLPKVHTENDEWNAMTIAWLFHDQVPFSMTQIYQEIKESTPTEQATATWIQL